MANIYGYSDKYQYQPMNAAPKPNGTWPHHNMPPQAPMRPRDNYGDCNINFGNDCSQSVENVVRGLNSAVSLLLDGGCPTQPNCCQPVPGNWCLEEPIYTQVNWIQNNSFVQPAPMYFTQPAKDCIPPITKKFNDFFCR